MAASASANSLSSSVSSAAAHVINNKLGVSASSSMDDLVEPIIEPIKSALVGIDKKIRNMEKKKSKLDNLRDEVQKSGKPLNEDQAQSLARYEDNNQQLETFRELQKQFMVCAEDIKKCYRKILRKEQQAEHDRLLDLERYRAVVMALESPDVLMDVIQETEGLPENCREQVDQVRRLLFPFRSDLLPEGSGGRASSEHLQFVTEQQCHLLHGRSLQVTPSGKELTGCKELLDVLLASPFFASHPDVLHSKSRSPLALPTEPHVAAPGAAKKDARIKSPSVVTHTPQQASSFKSADYQHGSSMSFVNSKISSGMVPPVVPGQQQIVANSSAGVPHTGLSPSAVPLGAAALPVSGGLQSSMGAPNVSVPPLIVPTVPVAAASTANAFPVSSGAAGLGAFHGHGPNLVPSNRSGHGSVGDRDRDRERSGSFGGLMMDVKEEPGAHVGAIGSGAPQRMTRPPLPPDNAVAQGQSAWQSGRIGTFDPKNPDGDASDLMGGADAFRSHSPADNQENRGFGDDLYKRRDQDNGFGYRDRGAGARPGMNRGGRGGFEPPMRNDRRSLDDSNDRGRMDDRRRFHNDRNMERGGGGQGSRGGVPPMGRYPGDNRNAYRNSNDFEHNGNGDAMLTSSSSSQNSMMMGKEMGEKGSGAGPTNDSHTDYGLFHMPNPGFKGRTGLEQDRRYDRNRDRDRERERERDRDDRNRGNRRTGNIYM
ncbi:uncharacterized protein LOC129590437 isoform X2 [Paramacrobiotus metropolitanus]|uniref:uncharacterized protein LOC129590437 isoform X2 n=1 Tax=Paramacrobiotus metropolitanus TaxID=2943436 RepID=UPI002445655F|nr:uncharacterized protein LOC129590437 isoform X2 [Paramacrobiotus metropolitanus]